MDLKDEYELIELAKEHKAKSRAIALEMLEDIPDADIKPYKIINTHLDLKMFFMCANSTQSRRKRT